MIILLAKTADSSHFIQIEAEKALDAMSENVPPQKALAVLINNGARYDDDILISLCQIIHTYRKYKYKFVKRGLQNCPGVLKMNVRMLDGIDVI